MCGKDSELYALSSFIKCLQYTEIEVLAEANGTKADLPNLPFLPPPCMINLVWLKQNIHLTIDGGSQRR